MSSLGPLIWNGPIKTRKRVVCTYQNRDEFGAIRAQLLYVLRKTRPRVCVVGEVQKSLEVVNVPVLTILEMVKTR